MASPGSKPQGSSRAVMSRVDLFLIEHQLGEYSEVFAQNGFEDLEDLVELVQHQHESALLTLMPKIGHRIKLIRSVNAVSSTELTSTSPTPPTLTKDLLTRKADSDETESVNESIMSYVSAMPPRVVSHHNINIMDDQSLARDVSLAPSGISIASTALTSATQAAASKPTATGGDLSLLSSSRLDDPARRDRDAKKRQASEGLDRRRVSSLNISAQNSAMPSTQQRQLSVKVVVVGQGGSGKSCFIARLVRNEYSDAVRTTLGVEFSEKRFMVGNTVLSLQFWDVWGQENSMSATRSYYTGARGAIVMYDAGDKSSLDKAVVWKKDIDTKARFGASGLPVPVILVGSKYDLTEESLPNSPNSSASGAASSSMGNSKTSAPDHSFSSPKTPATPGGAKQPLPTSKTVLKSQAEIQDFCNTHKFTGHFFASAKTGLCVRSVAEFLVLAVLKMDPHDTEPTDHKVVTLDHSTRARRATGLDASLPPPKSKSKFRCTML